MSGIFNAGKVSQILANILISKPKVDTLHDSRLTAPRAGYLDLINTNLDGKISEVGQGIYNSLLISADTTHNWPSGFVGVVFVSGAGGGGSGAFTTDGGYGGTGGQAAVRVPIWVNQTTDPSVSVTVGQGGAQKATTGPGNDGEDTVFGGFLTLVKGAGGSNAAAGSSPTAGTDGTETVDPAGPAGEGGRWVTGGTGGQGHSVGGSSGADGGDGVVENYRVDSLDNSGVGGNPSSHQGGGGGGSWGDGGDAAAPTKGGGGRGNDGGAAGQAGADGFIFLEWWT